VAPSSADRMAPLQPDTHIGGAAIGSGFAASVVNLGPQEKVTPSAASHDAVGVLRATDGPLRGKEFPLTMGHASIGRDPSNDIVLADAMVSKKHARVEVGGYVELVDLNSANGVIVDGTPVQRAKLVPGQTFVIGGTTLVLYLAGAVDGSAQDPILERGGGLLFNRSPPVDVRLPGGEDPPPRMPTELMQKLFPWTMLVAPIIMAGAIFAITGRERALLLIIMTPMMALGNYINQKRQAGNKQNHEVQL